MPPLSPFLLTIGAYTDNFKYCIGSHRRLHYCTKVHIGWFCTTFYHTEIMLWFWGRVLLCLKMKIYRKKDLVKILFSFKREQLKGKLMVCRQTGTSLRGLLFKMKIPSFRMKCTCYAHSKCNLISKYTVVILYKYCPPNYNSLLFLSSYTHFNKNREFFFTIYFS